MPVNKKKLSATTLLRLNLRISNKSDAPCRSDLCEGRQALTKYKIRFQIGPCLQQCVVDFD